MCVCVHNVGKSTDRPISWLKIAGTDPLLESQSSCCHMGGRAEGTAARRGWRGGPGRFPWGPRPLGRSPTVYPRVPAAASQGVFRTQLPEFLETALLRSICWAHF